MNSHCVCVQVQERCITDTCTMNFSRLDICNDNIHNGTINKILIWFLFH